MSLYYNVHVILHQFWVFKNISAFKLEFKISRHLLEEKSVLLYLLLSCCHAPSTERADIGWLYYKY